MFHSLLLTVQVLAQAPAMWSEDCGLEPPGRVIAPPPSKAFELPWAPGEPALVRRELGAALRGGVPAAHLTATGALSGKTVYLSAGHGFTWEPTLSAWRTQRGTTNEIVEDLVSTETISQYLLPMLLNAGARVVTVRESDLNPGLAIVDDGSAGYAESGPGFSDSTLMGWGPPPAPLLSGVNPFTLGGNRLLDAAATATASAVYTASLPADGSYNVYVSYTAFTARVSDAHYVVKHAGGQTHFRVNQRRSGGTWVLLGRFYFRKNQSAVVQVLNDSADTGNLSLDAVRFGGGMGVIDRGMGVSGRPRFEESARYGTQYAGAPTAVYDYSDTDHNDDVGSRSRFAAWVHEPGEDAVYLSWHTNAGGGVGSEFYVYGPNPPDGTYNFTGVAGSDTLARAVHDEFINDVRASSGWNKPAWADRGLKSAYFGEINPAHNNEMPSILMEMAFHDSATDGASLKEPGFRYLATRAIAQGIVRFFATRDGKAPAFAPEPPVQVGAVVQGSGAVRVSWKAPAVDAQNVGGMAAQSYRVYRSADALAWDDGVDVTTTSFEAPLAAGPARYFRVTALNAGGESFPSEVVGAKASAAGRVLIINGYDRLDASLARTEDLSAYSLANVLRVFVEKMNDVTYVGRHGDALDYAGVGFDSVSTASLGTSGVTPSAYAAIDYFAGRGHPLGAPPTAAEQTALKASKLFFTGARAARDLAGGSAADQLFLSQTLLASSGGPTPSVAVEGTDVPLDGVTGLRLGDGESETYWSGSNDLLGPAGSAVVASYSADGGAALAANHAVVSFGFPFETIASRPQRLDVMARVMKYLMVIDTLPQPFDAGMDGPDGGPVEPQPIVLDALPEQFSAAPGCGCTQGGVLLWAVGSLLVLLWRAPGTARRK